MASVFRTAAEQIGFASHLDDATHLKGPVHEIKLKLSLPPQYRQQIEEMPILRKALPRAKLNRLASVYFDTPHCKLQDAGFSLRVRSDGRRHVQTVTRADGSNLIASDEWETDLTAPTPTSVLSKTRPCSPSFQAKRVVR
jgi:inorganic triphosphatase YgiF